MLPTRVCVISGSIREQLHANVQADAGEVLLHMLNELRDEATRDEVRAILDGTYASCERQGSRGRLEIS